MRKFSSQLYFALSCILLFGINTQQVQAGAISKDLKKLYDTVSEIKKDLGLYKKTQEEALKEVTKLSDNMNKDLQEVYNSVKAIEEREGQEWSKTRLQLRFDSSTMNSKSLYHIKNFNFTQKDAKEFQTGTAIKIKEKIKDLNKSLDKAEKQIKNLSKKIESKKKSWFKSLDDNYEEKFKGHEKNLELLEKEVLSSKEKVLNFAFDITASFDKRILSIDIQENKTLDVIAKALDLDILEKNRLLEKEVDKVLKALETGHWEDDFDDDMVNLDEFDKFFDELDSLEKGEIKEK